jgi:hypothetical protein
LLGQLSDLGYGPDRVVPLALHVDYFNDPWKDPFSDPLFSRREAEYSRIYHKANKGTKPDVLYLTPLMMVDGRFPLLGSGPESKAKLRAALDRALREKPAVSLRLALEDAGAGPGRKSLKVALGALTPKVAGRKMLIGWLSSRTPSRPRSTRANSPARPTSVAHRPQARRPDRQPAGEGGDTLTFPIELADGWDPARCGLAAFARDEPSGRIYQAAMIPWEDREVTGR